MHYKWLWPNCCKCNIFRDIEAINCDNACCGPNGPRSMHESPTNSPWLVKREVGIPSSQSVAHWLKLRRTPSLRWLTTESRDKMGPVLARLRWHLYIEIVLWWWLKSWLVLVVFSQCRLNLSTLEPISTKCQFEKSSVQSLYLAVIVSFPNTHNRHPIAHPWGWAMGCVLWVQSLPHVWSLSLSCDVEHII